MNNRTTLILLGVLAALGAFVWYQGASNPDEVASPPVDLASAYVWQFSTGEVTGIRVTENDSGQTTALSRDAEGRWSVVEPYAADADQGQVESALANLAYLSVQRTLTETTDLRPFGVLEPAYTLEITLDDGSHKRLEIGQKVPSEDGFYALRPGEANALVVSGYSLRPVMDLAQTPPIEPTETPTPAGDETSPVEETPTPAG